MVSVSSLGAISLDLVCGSLPLLYFHVVFFFPTFSSVTILHCPFTSVGIKGQIGLCDHSNIVKSLELTISINPLIEKEKGPGLKRLFDLPLELIW